MKSGKRIIKMFGLSLLSVLVAAMLLACGKPQPEGIEITPRQVTLKMEESVQFEAVVTSEDGEPMPEAEVTWQVEGEAGAIDSRGNFTSKRPGEAFVIAQSGEVSDRVKVTVEEPPPELADVKITPRQKTVEMGEMVSFNAVALSTKNEEMQGVDIIWKAEGKAGTVDAAGNFSAKIPGEAQVTAIADAFSDTATVVVAPRRIATIKLKPEKQKAFPGSRITVLIEAFSADGQPAGYNRISLSSPAEEVVFSEKTLSLSPEGRGEVDVVLPSKPASVMVAFKGNGAEASLELEATKIVGLEITPGADVYEAGQRMEFEAVGYDAYGNKMPVDAAWSLTGDMVQLEEDGGVLMKQPGNGVVLAQYKDLTKGLPFRVVPGNPAEIKISPERVQTNAGQTIRFSAKVYNAHGHPLMTEVNWKVEGEVGHITADGYFQAQKVGKGAVAAAVGPAAAKVPVRVTHGPMADITIEIPSAEMVAGEVVALKAEGIDPYGNRFPIDVQWFLSKSIGVIDQEKNTFTARQAGTGEIRALKDNMMASQLVSVVPAEPVQLKITPPVVDLIAGQSVQFEVQGFDAYENRVAIEPAFSIQQNLGELSASGSFDAKTAGNTKIVASTADLIAEAVVTIKPAEMERVAAEPSDKVSLEAGKKQQFNAYGYDGFGNVVNSKTKWSVFPDLGDITPKGNFFAKQAGKGTITAEIVQLRTNKKIKIQLQLKVDPGPTAEIGLEPNRLVLEAGKETDFSATAYDEFGNETGGEIHWSVIGDPVGDISQAGAFKGKKSGKGQIRASSNGSFALADITVVPAKIELLKIIPESVTVNGGETVQLHAVGEDRFGNSMTPAVTWHLPNPELADIGSDGMLTGRRHGEGAIMVIAGNLVDDIPLRVEKGDLASIKIKPEKITMKAGESVVFAAKGYDGGGNLVSIYPQWSVSNALGSMEADGTFHAKTVGTGKVTVASGLVQGMAAIRVVPGAPSQIQVQAETIDATAGETVEMSIMVTDSNDNLIEDASYRWEISNQLGRMEDDTFVALKAGSGVLTARSGAASIEIPVNVTPAEVHTIEISPSLVEATAGKTVSFQARGYDALGNQIAIDPSWAVDKGLGDFKKKGVLNVLRTGMGYVTAQVADVIGVAKISVGPGPVHRIVVKPQHATVTAGKSIEYHAIAYDAQQNLIPVNLAWELGGNTPGSIDDSGKFTSRQAGTGVVIASADGVKEKAVVKVAPAALVQISVVPDMLALKAGEKQRLKIAGRDAFGNLKAFTPAFDISPDTLGALIDGTQFEAHKAGRGKMTIHAGGVERVVPIEITPGALANIEIQAPETKIKAGKTYRFKAQGYDAQRNKIAVDASWAVTPDVGRMEKESGLFHAQKTGTGIVVAYAQGLAGDLRITVSSGDLASLFIQPNPVTVTSNRNQRFTLEGLDVENNPVPVSVSAARWRVVGNIGQFAATGNFHATKMGKGKVTAAVEDLIAESYVTVTPGKPDVGNSRIRVTHPVLPADGTSYSEIIVDVKDVYGNPVPDTEVRLISSRQSDQLIQPLHTSAQGLARGRISASTPGAATIIAVVNGRKFEDTAEVTFK